MEVLARAKLAVPFFYRSYEAVLLSIKGATWALCGLEVRPVQELACLLRHSASFGFLPPLQGPAFNHRTPPLCNRQTGCPQVFQSGRSFPFPFHRYRPRPGSSLPLRLKGVCNLHSAWTHRY